MNVTCLSCRRALNPQPSVYKTVAPPIELRQHMCFIQGTQAHPQNDQRNGYGNPQRTHDGLTITLCHPVSPLSCAWPTRATLGSRGTSSSRRTRGVTTHVYASAIYLPRATNANTVETPWTYPANDKSHSDTFSSSYCSPRVWNGS
jgi:hypothetical protein